MGSIYRDLNWVGCRLKLVCFIIFLFVLVMKEWGVDFLVRDKNFGVGFGFFIKDVVLIFFFVIFVL